MNKGCPKCGRIVPTTEDVCPYCGYHFSEIEKVYKMAVNNDVRKIKENAGFIQRIVAFNFDMLFMVMIFGFLYFANPLDKYINFIDINIIYVALIVVIYVFYCSILEATPLKGTFGTRLLKLQVVDEGGYQIGFSMAFKHNVLKILNVLTLGIGYLALVFTKHKQTIADYFGDIYVENRSQDYNTKLYYSNLFLRVLAFAIDVLILILIYIVIAFIKNYLLEMGIITSVEHSNIVVTMILTITAIIYFMILDSRGGTFGKQLFSFEVTNLYGEKVNVLKTLARVFLLMFEILLLPFGLLLCLICPTKQTFKDLVTNTVVIKKVFYK